MVLLIFCCTIVLLMASHSFRQNYATGVDNFYTNHGKGYRNPHAPALKRVFRTMLNRWSNKLCFTKTLDLACGSGEVTEFLQYWLEKNGKKVKVGCIDHASEELEKDTIYIEGSDPFTYEAYEERMKVPAARYSFEDIENGILSEKNFDIIIASYAMHLVDPSRLYATCQQLAFISKYLIIIAPTKKPDIQSSMGWMLEETFTEDKIHVRLYTSIYQ